MKDIVCMYCEKRLSKHTLEQARECIEGYDFLCRMRDTRKIDKIVEILRRTL